MVIYLGLGVLADALVTGYYLCASRGRAFLASGLSIVIALLNFFVLWRVLEVDPSWVNAVAYAVGNGIGCFFVVKCMKKRTP